jgi:AcrR family transcriptional regulator
VARPREFDEQAVLARARDVFWDRGVEGASVSELCAATGLASGSIYKAWGSKTALHHATVDGYLTTALLDAARALEAGGSPLTALQDWLDGSARMAGGEADGPPGCYSVRCALDLSPDDPWVRERLRRHDRDLLDVVAAALSRAAAAGEIDCDDPRSAARLLLVTINGVQVEARKGITTDEARDLLQATLRRLT